MERILQLRQLQAAAVKGMRDLATKASNDGQRDFNEAEQKEYDALRSKVKGIKADILREEELRSLEGENKPPAETNSRNLESEDVSDGIRLARYAKVVVSSQRSQEDVKEIAKRMYPNDTKLRAMVTSTTSVAQNLSSIVIPYLHQKSVVRALGATVIPMANNMKMAKVTGAANFTWVGENKQIGNSTPGLTDVAMSAKKLSGIIPISNEMLSDNTIGGDQFVLEEIINGIAESEDISAFYGTGTSYAPKGIITALTDTALDVGSVVTDEVITEIVGTIMNRKININKVSWSFNGFVWKKLWDLKDATGSFIYREEMKTGTVCGRPFMINNNMSIAETANKPTHIVLGDFSQFLIGENSNEPMDISYSTDASYKVGESMVSAYENDLTLIRAKKSEDFAIRYNEAFVVAKNVWTTEA